MLARPRGGRRRRGGVRDVRSNAGRGNRDRGAGAAGGRAARVGGESEDARNRVSFRVESSREVENDWVSAVIGVTHEDTDPARLADRINVDMSWALETAQARQGLRVRSGGYRTFPVEDPKRAQLRRWRGSQDLIVEGADAKLVSDLLGELQSRLQLQSIVFRISPERLRAVEAELVDEALDAFRARAEGVRTKLGARGYEIVHIQVETPGGPPVSADADAGHGDGRGQGGAAGARGRNQHAARGRERHDRAGVLAARVISRAGGVPRSRGAAPGLRSSARRRPAAGRRATWRSPPRGRGGRRSG